MQINDIRLGPVSTARKHPIRTDGRLRLRVAVSLADHGRDIVTLQLDTKLCTASRDSRRARANLIADGEMSHLARVSTAHVSTSQRIVGAGTRFVEGVNRHPPVCNAHQPERIS